MQPLKKRGKQTHKIDMPLRVKVVRESNWSIGHLCWRPNFDLRPITGNQFSFGIPDNNDFISVRWDVFLLFGYLYLFISLLLYPRTSARIRISFVFTLFSGLSFVNIFSLSVLIYFIISVLLSSFTNGFQPS